MKDVGQYALLTSLATPNLNDQIIKILIEDVIVPGQRLLTPVVNLSSVLLTAIKHTNHAFETNLWSACFASLCIVILHLDKTRFEPPAADNKTIRENLHPTQTKRNRTPRLVAIPGRMFPKVVCCAAKLPTTSTHCFILCPLETVSKSRTRFLSLWVTPLNQPSWGMYFQQCSFTLR